MVVVVEIVVFAISTVVFAVLGVSLCSKKSSKTKVEGAASDTKTSAATTAPSTSKSDDKSNEKVVSPAASDPSRASVIPDKTLTCEGDPDLKTKSNYNLDTKTNEK